MDITFLGTSAGLPTKSRFCSSLALRLEDGTTYLVDCGEGAQIQVHHSENIRFARIERIFLTHLHGDHIFGLPGFLSTVFNQKAADLWVYGPPGLSAFISATLALTSSGFENPERLHIIELASDPTPVLPEFPRRFPVDQRLPGPTGTWVLPETSVDGVEVEAVRVIHGGMYALGYIFREHERPGKFDVATATQRGLKPGPLYSKLKAGQSVTLPDGTTLNPEDVVGPPTPGRTVVIIGDTNDPSAISAALHARAGVPDTDLPLGTVDCLVHEATMNDALKDKAVDYGHSTAGDSFAHGCSDIRAVSSTSLVFVYSLSAPTPAAAAAAAAAPAAAPTPVAATSAAAPTPEPKKKEKKSKQPTLPTSESPAPAAEPAVPTPKEASKKKDKKEKKTEKTPAVAAAAPAAPEGAAEGPAWVPADVQAEAQRTACPETRVVCSVDLMCVGIPRR
ncbi:putative Zinc phosphodiesterase ELAC protein 1 [Paratrimastix pyriformis]|uniref:Zinc phosphodiesterase ELAC protein 1 n=1 Tax=Paratrimastix pyriformis TaxID=342808 RepID=A0ABQ8UGS1_9EUKA|nr:putative Zinc phosphodiesterase ELAC protein 1 [Paratrimastix pyriformis]